MSYNQIGAGLETLGPLFDFRINGYLPAGKKTVNTLQTSFTEFSGHSLILAQKYQLALKGADAECGFHFGKWDRFDFYTAFGPYYFRGQIGSNTWGGKARIAGTYKDSITIELSNSYDNTFHNKFQGQVALHFSFGPTSKVKRKGNTCEVVNALTARMVQPVDRQEIIVVDKKKQNSVAIDPATGLPYYFVFVNNTSSSNGTFESPYPLLLTAETNSKPYDIIYIFAGDTTTKGMNTGITLQNNQSLLGSGVSHSLLTTVGTVVIPPLTSTLPSLTNMDGSGAIVVLGDNCQIAGFNLFGNLNNAIVGGDYIMGTFSSNGGIIQNNVINVTTGSGVSLIGHGNAILTNNQITSDGPSISLQTILAETLVATVSDNALSSSNNTLFIRNGVDGLLTSSIYTASTGKLGFCLSRRGTFASDPPRL